MIRESIVRTFSSDVSVSNTATLVGKPFQFNCLWLLLTLNFILRRYTSHFYYFFFYLWIFSSWLLILVRFCGMFKFYIFLRWFKVDLVGDTFWLISFLFLSLLLPSSFLFSFSSPPLFSLTCLAFLSSPPFSLSPSLWLWLSSTTTVDWNCWGFKYHLHFRK